MNIIDRMQMLNNNKLARMIMVMAETSCSCSDYANEIKEIAQKAIMNPVEDIYADLKLDEQSKLLQDAVIKLYERTASHTESLERIKEIKDSDEMQTLRKEMDDENEKDMFTAFPKYNEFVSEETEPEL